MTFEQAIKEGEKYELAYPKIIVNKELKIKNKIEDINSYIQEVLHNNINPINNLFYKK